MANRDLSWCGFDFDGPCPELEPCSVHVLAAQRDRLREALTDIAYYDRGHPARFRKKPVEVEAVHWTGENYYEVMRFAGADEDKIGRNGTSLSITTLEGVMFAPRDYWIIRGVAGELYPCEPEIFARTYEAVE